MLQDRDRKGLRLDSAELIRKDHILNARPGRYQSVGIDRVTRRTVLIAEDRCFVYDGAIHHIKAVNTSICRREGLEPAPIQFGEIELVGTRFVLPPEVNASPLR